MRLKKFARPKKGRGLGYVGAKRLISWAIGEEIEFQVPDFDIFVDAFGGGGSMSCEFLMRDKKVVYNDLDKSIYEVFKYVMETRFEPEFYKELLLDKAEFDRILKKSGRTVVDNLKLLINSFGNRSGTYLYSKANEKAKFSLAQEILKDDALAFKNYRKNPIFIAIINDFKNRKDIEKNRLLQLERLHQLHQLRQLGEIQHIQTSEIAFENLDYKSFIAQQRNQKAVLYCDIPYENTTEYAIGKFNHKEFFDFVSKEAKHFKAVFVSSYRISDGRFKLIKEFSKKSTLSGGTSSTNNTEKLYTLKSFKLARQMDIFDYIN